MVEVVGRLDHLVEAVFERFKDRYFADESTSSSCTVSSVLIASPYLIRGFRRCTGGQVSSSLDLYVIISYPPGSTPKSSGSACQSHPPRLQRFCRQTKLLPQILRFRLPLWRPQVTCTYIRSEVTSRYPLKKHRPRMIRSSTFTRFKFWRSPTIRVMKKERPFKRTRVSGVVDWWMSGVTR